LGCGTIDETTRMAGVEGQTGQKEVT
jgi:hypothetical protein